MKKRNRGQITVYVSAMLCVFLILILTVLQGIRIWEGRAKCCQSIAGVVSSLKGDYQPDLFRRYHLLALDRTYYGRGEGYMEERAKEYLEYNLNSGNSLYQYQVEDVMLTESVSLLDDDLSGFHRQIQDDMTLRLPLSLVDALLDKARQGDTGNQEEILEQEFGNLPDSSENEDFSYESIGTLTGGDIKALGLEEDLLAEGITDFDNLTVEDLLQTDFISQGGMADPRDHYNTIRNSDILPLLIPEQAGVISKERMDVQGAPSAKVSQSETGGFETGLPVLEEAEDISGFSFDDSLWSRSFDSSAFAFDEPAGMEGLYGTAYSIDSFQCFGHPVDDGESGDYHALECEIEYILAGEVSDYENLSRIAEELTAIRFVPNAAYAFTDETMKKEALLAATLLLAPVQLEAAAEPVSYVLLACWAYGESLIDVRGLLQGKYIPFTKDDSSWQLSLNGMKNLAEQEVSDCGKEQGTNYEEYLTLLLLLAPNQQLQYYRMLDVMEWNLQQQLPGFMIQNCIITFRLQTRIRENDRSWYLEQQGSYLSEQQGN